MTMTDAPEPGAKRKRRQTAKGDDFVTDDKELDAGIREAEKKPPKMASIKPKASGTPPSQKIVTELESENQKKMLTPEEESLMAKYDKWREVREQARRQPSEQTPADRDAERQRAAQDATAAALAAIEQQRQQGGGVTEEGKQTVTAQHRGPSRRAPRAQADEEEDE